VKHNTARRRQDTNTTTDPATDVFRILGEGSRWVVCVSERARRVGRAAFRVCECFARAAFTCVYLRRSVVVVVDVIGGRWVVRGGVGLWSGGLQRGSGCVSGICGSGGVRAAR
jgi:hypothetical protein